MVQEEYLYILDWPIVLISFQYAAFTALCLYAQTARLHYFHHVNAVLNMIRNDY